MGNYDCKSCFSRENEQNAELPLDNSQEIRIFEEKGENTKDMVKNISEISPKDPMTINSDLYNLNNNSQQKNQNTITNSNDNNINLNQNQDDYSGIMIEVENKENNSKINNNGEKEEDLQNNGEEGEEYYEEGEDNNDEGRNSERWEGNEDEGEEDNN